MGLEGSRGASTWKRFSLQLNGAKTEAQTAIVSTWAEAETRF